MDVRRLWIIRQRWYGLLVVVVVVLAVAVVIRVRSVLALRQPPTVACPPTPPGAAQMVSMHPGVQHVLAPPGAVAVDVCEYNGSRRSSTATFSYYPVPPGHVETGTVLADLSATFDVPVISRLCTVSAALGTREVLFRFRYATAGDVSVVILNGACAPSGDVGDIFATNGTITGYFHVGPVGNVLNRFNGPYA